MKIGIGVNSWNQPEGLIRTLESAKEFDRKIVIDGRYHDRTDGPEFSGYEPICEKHNAELFYKSNCKEHEKRNIYFEMANDLDVLIVIDDDEIITKFDRKRFEDSLTNRKNDNSLTYNLEFWENNTQYEIPRIFITPLLCYYKDRHNMVWSRNREIFGRNIGPKINGIVIIHDKYFRGGMRDQIDLKYRQSHAFE